MTTAKIAALPLLLASLLLAAGCFEGKALPDCGACQLPDASPDMPPRPDTGTPDRGPDAPTPDRGPDRTVTGGLVVITEVHPNPKSAKESGGEWFEIYNAGGTRQRLNSWVIKDRKTSHTISQVGDLFIEPGQYLVLGQKKDKAANGGVEVAYAYGTSIALNNTNEKREAGPTIADELVLVDNLGKLVDRVTYDETWPFADGSAMSLGAPGLDNATKANWCKETQPWGTVSSDAGAGDAGAAAADNGTPGKKAGCTP